MTADDMYRILDRVRVCIQEWRASSHGPFSWVDDALVAEPRSYNIHVAWVRAWNASGRTEDMDVFLEKWATEDNIKKAVA